MIKIQTNNTVFYLMKTEVSLFKTKVEPLTIHAYYRKVILYPNVKHTFAFVDANHKGGCYFRQTSNSVSSECLESMSGDYFKQKLDA